MFGMLVITNVEIVKHWCNKPLGPAYVWKVKPSFSGPVVHDKNPRAAGNARLSEILKAATPPSQLTSNESSSGNFHAERRFEPCARLPPPRGLAKAKCLRVFVSQQDYM